MQFGGPATAWRRDKGPAHAVNRRAFTLGLLTLAEHRIRCAVHRRAVDSAEESGETRGLRRCSHDHLVGNTSGDRLAVIGGDGASQH